MAVPVAPRKRPTSPFKRWLFKGYSKEARAESPHAEPYQHQHTWPQVMCLTGVDYFSTFFILTIVITSFISRVQRSTEVRFHKVELDARAESFIRELAGKGEIRIVGPSRTWTAALRFTSAAEPGGAAHGVPAGKVSSRISPLSAARRARISVSAAAASSTLARSPRTKRV